MSDIQITSNPNVQLPVFAHRLTMSQEWVCQQVRCAPESHITLVELPRVKTLEAIVCGIATLCWKLRGQRIVVVSDTDIQTIWMDIHRRWKPKHEWMLYNKSERQIRMCDDMSCISMCMRCSTVTTASGDTISFRGKGATAVFIEKDIDMKSIGPLLAMNGFRILASVTRPSWLEQKEKESEHFTETLIDTTNAAPGPQSHGNRFQFHVRTSRGGNVGSGNSDPEQLTRSYDP